MKIYSTALWVTAVAITVASCSKDLDIPDPIKPGDKYSQEYIDSASNPIPYANTIPEFYTQEREDVYAKVGPKFVQVADRSDGLEAPSDLDFHPFADRSTELWVLSPGAPRFGGFTTIFQDPMTDPDNRSTPRDGAAGHFMALSTSMEFGDNGYWASSQGVLDANFRDIEGLTFTGPSLWPSDMDIYTRVGKPATAQYNGSHLDMVHQSPMGMGIAYEKDNIYWVFDGYHGTIVQYDFAEPHYPGGDDHSDARVRRFQEPGVNMSTTAGVPSHLVYDHATDWLYICDSGNKRVIRINTKSGSKAGNKTGVISGERIAFYEELDGVEWNVIAEGLDMPSGIALKENRLFVGDYETGAIICYDINTLEELGRMETEKGLTGLEIGPDNKLWYTNAVKSTLNRIDPQPFES